MGSGGQKLSSLPPACVLVVGTDTQTFIQSVPLLYSLFSLLVSLHQVLAFLCLQKSIDHRGFTDTTQPGKAELSQSVGIEQKMSLSLLLGGWNSLGFSRMIGLDWIGLGWIGLTTCQTSPVNFPEEGISTPMECNSQNNTMLVVYVDISILPSEVALSLLLSPGGAWPVSKWSIPGVKLCIKLQLLPQRVVKQGSYLLFQFWSERAYIQMCFLLLNFLGIQRPGSVNPEVQN